MLHKTVIDHVTGLITTRNEGKYGVICERKYISMHRKYVVLEITHKGYQAEDLSLKPLTVSQ